MRIVRTIHSSMPTRDADTGKDGAAKPERVFKQLNQKFSSTKTMNKWTVDGLLNPRPDYIAYRWMQFDPDLTLLKTIGSIYNIQVIHSSPYAIDSLRCFYAVHDYIANPPERMEMSSPVTIPDQCGGIKRSRGGWDLERKDNTKSSKH